MHHSAQYRLLLLLLLVPVGILPIPPALGQATADDKSSVEAAQKPKREPIYDEKADAPKQIEEALARAEKENRRVLIQWGANWCGWCYLLHDTMKENREIARKLQYEYDVVLVDIGKMDQNQDLLEKYEVDIRNEGVPFLTVLDPAGKVIANQETASLESKEEGVQAHEPDAVLDFLTKHQSTPQDAEQLLAAAMEQAKSSKRLVFLHFGAPWCGWCHRLEDWIAKPDVAQRLGKTFVDLKIDNDRMTNAEDVYSRYCKEPGGIPWFVFLDPTQEQPIVITSDGSNGNLGFPWTDEEITDFGGMLDACEARISDDQKAWLLKSLKLNREEVEAANQK